MTPAPRRSGSGLRKPPVFLTRRRVSEVEIEEASARCPQSGGRRAEASPPSTSAQYQGDGRGAHPNHHQAARPTGRLAPNGARVGIIFNIAYEGWSRGRPLASAHWEIPRSHGFFDSNTASWGLYRANPAASGAALEIRRPCQLQDQRDD